jgi:hypothetical protein
MTIIIIIINVSHFLIKAADKDIVIESTPAYI